MGPASVVCGWVKGVTKKRHIWEEWRRDAAERLEKQSKDYAACVNEVAKERASMQKEHDEAAKKHAKAVKALKEARERERKEHLVEQRRLEVQTWKEKRAAAAERMAKAPPRLRKMWEQYVKDHDPPEPPDFNWKSR